MKVRELIEKLQEFDQELEVEFHYTYYSGCCSSNSWEDSDERDVGTVELASNVQWVNAPGPRGGPVRRRAVEVPIVRLSE